MSVIFTTTTQIVVARGVTNGICPVCHSPMFEGTLFCGVYTSTETKPQTAETRQFTSMHLRCASNIYGVDNALQAEKIFATVEFGRTQVAQG